MVGHFANGANMGGDHWQGAGHGLHDGLWHTFVGIGGQGKHIQAL